VPNYITFIWKDGAGKKNGLEIRPFDEQETLSAFKKLGDTDPIDLVIRLNGDETDAQVSLKNKREEIRLVKGKIDISRNLD
jgi:hypothetical protein